jgi:ACS family pantothenate transporter-like MFS transporter
MPSLLSPPPSSSSSSLSCTNGLDDRYQDDQLRSVVIASMNLGSNAVNAWWSILFYGANFAPKFTRGMWAMIGTSIALAVWATALIFMGRREKAKRERGVVGEVGEGRGSYGMEDEEKKG